MATYPTGVKYRGLNRSGAEYGDIWSESINGWDGDSEPIIPGTEQLSAELTFYASKGFNILRVPISWERVQHKLNEELDEAYSNKLIALINGATAAGWHVIIDLHNYARYAVGAFTDEGVQVLTGYKQKRLGDGYLTFAHLADVWTRVAAVFKDNPRVIFGLMNEPNDLDHMGAHEWFGGMQTVIDAMRAIGATQLILVPNRYGWVVTEWDKKDDAGVSDSEAALDIADSAGNYAFDMHAYCSETDDPDAYKTLVAPVTEWAAAHGKTLFLSEMGVENDAENAKVVLQHLFDYLNENADVWVGWTAWNLTPYNLTPEGDYTSDGTQMPWYADPLTPNIVSAPDSPGSGKPLPSQMEQIRDLTKFKETLPYASEPFGVYQPLIGWRSQIGHERLSKAVTNRVMKASRLIGQMAVMTDERPIGTVREQTIVDRTGTQVGRRLAALVSGQRQDWSAILRNDESSPLVQATSGVLKAAQNATPPPSLARVNRSSTNPAVHRDAAQLIQQEASLATALHYISEKAPSAILEMFRPAPSSLARVIASLKVFTESHPAKSAFLSPIGILHLFREYFFQLGTFLGPPVGHVWISPGGTVELVEVNTRRVLVERSVEQSTETVSKSELDQTDKDELSDAVKTENANDMKLGVGATASGGITGIFQASGSASFNLDVSRKEAQEQTHKKMREQSAKLSSEVRQNFKTTFRTVTETTDTSSRRYLLQNTSSRLVSYELSRKMRKVAVQVQDLGERLCWQLYVDNPGDPLGTGEFVHATGEALDPGLKVPEQKPYPANQQKTFSSSIPFILYQGADDDAENTYELSGDNADHGIFVPDVGTDDIIQFKFDIKCPPAPPGFVLSQVSALDFHGGQVKWDPDLKVDIANEQFTIRLTFANFGGKQQLPFDATLVYEATKDIKAAIDKENAASKAVYDDQVAHAKEKLFYDTLRTRLKLVGQVRPRPQDDLREEERTMVYRTIIATLYGSEAGWTNDDYHVASEMIRYFFDVDAMLYFVAPDWWRPRHQQLASMDDKGQLQPTIIAEPALSARLAVSGQHIYIQPGHRPYYLITEETTPAPQGASLGWLIQLDGDTHRNAFLNSPWVKAVLPIRPGRERDAIAFLQRPEVAGTDGLDEAYPFDAATDPADYAGLTIKQVLFKIADKIAQEYKASLTPVRVDPTDVNSKLALPTETVFAHGFDPLEGGIAFGSKAFRVFSEWIEVLPTDQVVATEYSLKGL